MAKVSYILTKYSTGNGKSNFHFDGGNGSEKWFSKIFKNGKEENSSEPNEVVDLISKLVIDGDYSISKNNETRIEFEGSVEEIKEIATWSINQVKAEASALKNIAEFLKEYCSAISGMFKDIFGCIEHADQTDDKLEAEKSSSGFDPDAKVEKQ